MLGQVTLIAIPDINNCVMKALTEKRELRAIINDGSSTGCRNLNSSWAFLGADPTSILLKHNGLHFEVQIDRDHNVGAVHPAGVKDVVLSPL